MKPTTETNGRAWFIVTLEVPWSEGGLIAAGTSPTGSTTIVGVDGTVTVTAQSATFTVNSTFISAVRGITLPLRLLCRVIVKCDFLVDGNNNPVDGDHLAAKLPTGDGIPGGDFESWFIPTTMEIAS